MENEVLFYEVQRKSPWWVYLIVVLTNIIMIYALYQQIISGLLKSPEIINVIAFVFTVVSMVILNLFLFLLRLETIIKKNGVFVRYFPIHRKYRSYFFDNIDKCYIRRFRPIAEYGGWGIRGYGNNRSFTVSGEIGAQIELKNGSKTLVGTHKPEELGIVLEKLGFNKP